MDNKFANIKERIIYISDYYGITKEKFFEDLGISYGNFKGNAKKTAINSTFLENLLSKFSDLSPEWLLTGSGNMLKSDEKHAENANIVSEAGVVYCSNGNKNRVSHNGMPNTTTLLSQKDEQIANMMTLLTQKDEQINKLLSIIEKLSST